MTTAPQAQRKPGEADPIAQLAILVGIIALSLNVGFYFLSDAYFDDRVKRLGAQELTRLSGARIDFAIFTIVVGAGVIAAALRPRQVAFGVAVVAGVGSLIAVPFAAGIGIVLATMLLLVAATFEILVWLSAKRRSRRVGVSVVAVRRLRRRAVLRRAEGARARRGRSVDRADRARPALGRRRGAAPDHAATTRSPQR